LTIVNKILPTPNIITMKTLIKTSVVLLLICFTTFYRSEAKDTGFTREIKKEFPVNPDAKLVLENKYGDIHISNSNKNTVSIKVLISVDAPDLEKAVKVFEKVKIQFSNTADLVEAKTMLDEGLKIKGGFSVDYEVIMPVTMSLEADNKFGNLVAGEIGGKAKISVSYGNLEVSRLSNSDNLIEVKFGDAGINWIKGAVMTLKYSDFEGDYAGSIMLNSEYSKFSASKVIVMDATFSGGDLELTTASVLTCRSKFSDITIGSLDQKIDLINGYGNIEVDEVLPGFNAISITNEYGNVELGFASSTAFRFDVGMRYCNLDYDRGKANVEYSNESDHNQQVRGTFGSNPSALVKITSEFGNVSCNKK